MSATKSAARRNQSKEKKQTGPKDWIGYSESVKGLLIVEMLQ